MDVKVTKSLLMTALITGSVLWGGTNVFAAESVGEFELDPMVVTAQRMETRDVGDAVGYLAADSVEIAERRRRLYVRRDVINHLTEPLERLGGLREKRYATAEVEPRGFLHTLNDGGLALRLSH